MIKLPAAMEKVTSALAPAFTKTDACTCLCVAFSSDPYRRISHALKYPASSRLSCAGTLFNLSPHPLTSKVLALAYRKNSGHVGYRSVLS